MFGMHFNTSSIISFSIGMPLFTLNCNADSNFKAFSLSCADSIVCSMYCSLSDLLFCASENLNCSLINCSGMTISSFLLFLDF